jgi:hypothetical protein
VDSDYLFGNFLQRPAFVQGFPSEHPGLIWSTRRFLTKLALQGAQRQTVIPTTRSVAIHSLKDPDDAYQAVGELVDILSEGNLVSASSRI